MQPPSSQGRSRTRAAGTLAAAACLTLVSVLSAAPAQAEQASALHTGIVHCVGPILLEFSPGLTHTPREVTITVYRSYDACASLTNPQITSGDIETEQVTLVRSCDDLLIPAKLTLSIDWADGTTSTLVYNSTTTYLNGNLAITQMGKVASGTFAGGSMTGGIVLPADLLACGTPEGITTLDGHMELTIVSL